LYNRGRIYSKLFGDNEFIKENLIRSLKDYNEIREIIEDMKKD